MNRVIILLTLIASSLVLRAQSEVRIYLTDIYNQTLKTTMEDNVSKLVSEINNAHTKGTEPDFSSIAIEAEAQENILQIWEFTTFKCVKSEIMSRCLNTSTGYQIRNLPFLSTEDDEKQEVAISFNSSGSISDFSFSIANNTYSAIMKGGEDVTDLRRRQVIVDFVENFRTAYNRKDLPLITQMYSDDALIITGKMYKAVGEQATGLSEERVSYVKHNKQEYMSRLKRVFASNKYVNIGFEDIEVMKHPVKKNIYGVTLCQKWRTSNYNDDGWLFLAIEFKSETEMLIHVRTWQPYMLNGQVFSRYEIFQLGDFNFH